MWLSLFLASVTASSLFITTWNTTSPNETIIWPTISAQSLVTIDWGDNSANSTINPGTNVTGLPHEYAVAGLHNVSVLGEFRWISPISDHKLVDIVSWGDGFLVDSNSLNLFAFCSNLRVSASPFTQPVFLPGARLDGMFFGTSFDSPLNWDLLNVTSVINMFASTPVNNLINFSNTQGLVECDRMFYNASNFNQPFTMDIPNVVSVDRMFHSAVSFNQPVTLTNSKKLTSTYFMFYSASSFNQPFTLDTSSVINMAFMFYRASSFNQTVNFSSTANVTTMSVMFLDAPLFEQDLASWNTSSVTECNDFCPRCGLPAFPLCGPCPGGSPKYTNERNMSVCYSLAPTTSSPTGAPSTAYPTSSPTSSPTGAPSTLYPTSQPTSPAPTLTPSSAAPSLAPSVDLSTVVSPAEKPSVRAVGLIAVVVAVLVN